MKITLALLSLPAILAQKCTTVQGAFPHYCCGHDETFPTVLSGNVSYVDQKDPPGKVWVTDRDTLAYNSGFYGEYNVLIAKTENGLYFKETIASANTWYDNNGGYTIVDITTFNGNTRNDAVTHFALVDVFKQIKYTTWVPAGTYDNLNASTIPASFDDIDEEFWRNLGYTGGEDFSFSAIGWTDQLTLV